MDERVVKFRVGVLVLATLLIGAILVMLFGKPPAILKGKYPIVVHLPHARGVQSGTPVRKSGILIGRVTDVEFADAGGVNLTLEIDGDISLSRDEVCQLTSPLFGDAELEFMPRTPSKATGERRE